MMGEFGFGRTLFPVRGVPVPIHPLLVHTALEGAGVTQLYPGFEDWFLSKVVPGMRGGERRIIAYFLGSMLAGIAICKRTEAEKKLCTLWVSPRARGRGIAIELAGEAFDWLGTTKPLFTVPEERIAEFSGLLNSWSFSEPVAYRDLYRPKRIEYVFNGCICGMAH